MTYLITFACYGCHLHGDGSGCIDPTHNMHGTAVLESDSSRAEFEKRNMNQPVYRMDQIRRDTVLEAIREVCGNRGWTLLAAHVRSNHVHTVVDAEAEPERVMKDFKAYATRRLNATSLDDPERKRWARHGSTRWLWKPHVVAEQGEAMSVFESQEF